MYGNQKFPKAAPPSGVTSGLTSTPPPQPVYVSTNNQQRDNSRVNPIRRSAMMVDWESVFTTLFRKVSPERISEVKEALISFDGMFESAFTSLCNHYKVKVPVEYLPIPIDPTSEWTKLRIARMMVKCQSAALFQKHLLDDAIKELNNPKNNPNAEFEKLEQRYGPEPLPREYFTYLERFTIACAMADRMEPRHQYTTQVMLQVEDEEITFNNAIEGLIEKLPNGEIFWEDVADPRDIRTRLKNMLAEYDKPLLSKSEAILDAATDPVALFTQLQRTYGREPRVLGANLIELRSSSSNNNGSRSNSHTDPLAESFEGHHSSNPNSPHHVNVSQNKSGLLGLEHASEKENAISQAAANQASHLEALRNDIFLLRKSTEYARDAVLDEVFDDLANCIIEATPVNGDDLKYFTTRIFAVLDRSMLNVVDKIVAPRVDPRHKYDYETQEWLQFLHCFYLNGVPPQSNNVSLRTVVSLLYMKLGGAIWEVKAAGGVEGFMEKAGSQDAQEQQDRAFNLRVMYGSVPDEADLAIRNRKRIYFNAYNPTFPLDKIDTAVEKLLATNREGKPWEDIFRNLFGGPPPRPIPVSERRVRDILRRFAHTKENDWRIIAAAHTDVGDTPESVIQNLVQTYGPERSQIDGLIEHEVLSAECESRFTIFAHEMRTRDVIIRRAAAALSSGDPQSSKKFGSRAIDQRLQIQKMLVAKSVEEERKRQEKSKNDLKSLQMSQIDTLLSEEDDDRRDIETEERALREPIVAEILRAFPEYDTDVNLDIGETLVRHLILDEARAAIRELKKQMQSDSQYLQTFLADRLLWRKKWERDEEIRVAILEMKDFERQKEEEARLARESELKKRLSQARQSVQSREHDAKIRDLYDQVNAQTRHNLSFQVEVENHRAQYRAEKISKVQPTLDRYATPSQIHHARGAPLHRGCCFENKERFHITNQPLQQSNQPRYAVLPPGVGGGASSTSLISSFHQGAQAQLESQNEPDGMTEDEMNYMFQDQLREYLQNLFRRYDPKLEGTERQLLSQFIGKEAKLIAALEQQYNIDHWMESHLHHRLVDYYRKMAPESMDEIPSIVQRFIGNEEAMWAFLKDRHGPVPALQSTEMQKYIRSRFIRYFSQRSKEHMQHIDRYIAMIGDTNGDAVFRDLALEFGPEDHQIQLDTLIRKLRRFYRERGIRRQYDDIPTIARRFLGHESLLNRLLQAKFDDNLQLKKPDVSDFKD